MKQNYSTMSLVIDNTATFLNWAKTVQFDVMKWARPRCDYQDDYARTPQATIDQAFNEATPDERRTILCAVYNTMSYDEVERLLLVRAKQIRAQELNAAYAELDEADNRRRAELDRREAELARREQAARDAMKPYHKRLAELRRQVKDLAEKAEYRRKEADRWREEAKKATIQGIDDHEDAKKFRQIRTLLA